MYSQKWNCVASFPICTLWTRPRSFNSGNICFKFSVQCLCSAVVSLTSEKFYLGFCGDGRVDPGEECDCGSVESCLAARSCCSPPGLRRGELACHWRRSLPACRNTSASTGEQKTVVVGRKKNAKKDKTGNKMAGFMADKMAERGEESLCRVLGLKPCRCKIISVTSICRTKEDAPPSPPPLTGPENKEMVGLLKITSLCMYHLM